jgi:hypothetical protein
MKELIELCIMDVRVCVDDMVMALWGRGHAVSNGELCAIFHIWTALVYNVVA